MRKDMDRVMVGRPRIGGRGSKRTGRGKEARNLEDLPTKEGMKKRWKDRKSLNENLSPFFRYLDKQVGRPWNDVYSEIREHISARSAVQMHILEHLEQHVKLHVDYREDGKPYVRDGYGWQHGYEVDGLFVCPNTGLLKDHKTPSWNEKWRRENRPKYLTIDSKNYIKGKHGWAEITLGDARFVYVRNPTGEFGRHYSVPSSELHWDQLHKKMMTVPELKEYYGREVRCLFRRQLNKKEIKSLGLNDKPKG